MSASAVLVAAGDDPDRLRSEGFFVHLCGVAPLDASSGKQQRHRLNRGGDRQANCALHTVALVRMSHVETTREYLARRIAGERGVSFAHGRGVELGSAAAVRERIVELALPRLGSTLEERVIRASRLGKW